MKRKLYGEWWNIPIIKKTGFAFAYDNSEKWIYQLLKSLDSEIRFTCFIDIGANIGQTLLKVKSIKKDIIYIGFEPNVNCLYYLNQLMQLNSSFEKDLEIIPLGLGNENKILTLEGFNSVDERATLVPNEIPIQNKKFKKKVPIFRLDDISEELNLTKKIILKIDVEGFEYNVLKGAEKTIFSLKPLIIFEVLPHQGNLEKLNTQENLYSFFEQMQYSLFLINRVDGKINLIEKFNSDFKTTDYLAVPISKKSFLTNSIPHD